MNPPAVSGRRIAASGAILLVEYALRMGMTAAIAFWIARQLGPSQFGILNYASATASIFLAFVALGIDVPAVLRLSQGRDADAVLPTAIAMRFAAALAAFAAMALLAVATEGDSPQVQGVMLIVASSLVAYAPNIFDHWFKAHVQAVAPAVARIVATVLSIGAKALCLWFELGVVALAWTVVLEALLHSAALWLAWRFALRGQPRPARLDPVVARSLLHEGLPYLGSSIAVILFMKLDVVMLGHLSTHEQTGIYSLVQKLSEVLYIVPVVIVDTVYPALSRRHLVPGEHIAREGQLLFDLTFAVTLVAMVIGIVLSGPVIGFVFGPRYDHAIPLFHVHAWTCLALALNVARLRWLATLGLQRHAPLLTVAGAVINATLNALMIPVWGAWGAVWAANVSWVAAGFLMSFVIPDLRPVGRMQARALWPWGRLAGFACRARTNRS